MRIVLQRNLRLRREGFGAVLLVPFELERPDIPQFFKLNKFGTKILELCEKPTTCDEIVASLSSEYPNKRSDINQFISELLQIGILVEIEKSSTDNKHEFCGRKKNLKLTPKLSSPLSAFIEITDKCVLQCIHCYTKSKKSTGFVSENQWVLQLIRELSELGVMTIGFGGGEPTLDRRLSTYLSYCSSEHIKTAISTSGFLVNKKMVQELKESGLGIAQISLDGPREVHEFIRGPGTYEKAIRALNLFSNIGIETRVAMTISSINRNHIKETANLVFENGSDRFVVFRYMPSGPNGNKLSLSTYELKEVTSTLVSLEKEHEDTVIGYEPLCFFPHLIDNNLAPLGPCNAGTDVLNICADGTVTPCPHMRHYILGKYPHDSIEKIWGKSAEFGKKIITMPPQECTKCDFRDTCGGGCNSHLRNDEFRRRDNMCWNSL